MGDRKSRILLFTRAPDLEKSVMAALEDERHHVIEVGEVRVLEPLLQRGAELVALDLELPAEALGQAAEILAGHRQVPALVLNQGDAARWHEYSPGSPLEEVLDVPFQPEELCSRVDGLLHRGRFLRGNELVGRSRLLRELRERILLIAPTPVSTVLITGESGTGKDLVAETIHRYSERRDRPFKPINCAAIPENLLENELFGHEKGAYTDAKAQSRGIFEQADGGTVFLDEIGEMAPAAQVRLLRVLEQRVITRIGGNAALPVDLRVIAATNKDLQSAVSRREFRLDLYHRLKVVELSVPALRERPEDIPLLIDHFVEQLSRGRDARFSGFSTAAMDLLQRYPWPGNVRELRNLVEHLLFLGPRGRVQPGDLLGHLESPPPPERHLPVPTHKTPDQSERELIYFALLDLKREVAELRRLIEQGAAPPLAAREHRPGRAVFPLEEQPFATEEDEADDALSGSPVEPQRTLKDLEREAIEQALQQVAGNRKRAAELLGISTRTLYRKLDEYGLK